MVSLADRITEEIEMAPPRTVEPGRVVASGIGACFWAVGWVAFWVLAVVGGVMRAVRAAAGWCAAGVRLGWLDAREQAARRNFAPERWPTRARKPRAAGGTG